MFEHITTYNHQGALLVNKDYGRHVRRAWVDTHNQSIRMDPDIYLPGEAAAKEEGGDSADDDDNDDNDDGLSDVTSGVKRKERSWTRSSFSSKVAKTTAQGGPSSAAMGAIDDHRPDLTLIDAPDSEDIPTYPYGRHGCLYIKVKAAANKKPNPQEAVSLLFHGFLVTQSHIRIGHEETSQGPQERTPGCWRTAKSQVYPSPDRKYRPSPPCHPSVHAILPPHHTLRYHLQYLPL